MRLTAAAIVFMLAAGLAACAGGEPTADATDPAGAAGAAAPASTAGAAPASPPAAAAPPQATGEASAPPSPASPAPVPLPYPSDLAAHAGLRVDCRADSECAVKDVGNCCGRYDACVRADSQPDPAAVQAECAVKGQAGICGFPVIEACVCTAGTCQAAPSDGSGAAPAVQ
jgi:hypothetical protein